MDVVSVGGRSPTTAIRKTFDNKISKKLIFIDSLSLQRRPSKLFIPHRHIQHRWDAKRYFLPRVTGHHKDKEGDHLESSADICLLF